MLQNAVERSYEKGSYGTLFACCSAFMLMSFYIRSDVRTFPRYFICNALPVIVVQQLILPNIKANKDAGKRPESGFPVVSFGTGGHDEGLGCPSAAAAHLICWHGRYWQGDRTSRI